MKTYRGMEVKLHTLLTSVLDAGEWSASRQGHLTLVSIGLEAGGPQRQSGRCGEERNACPAGNQTQTVHPAA
jgi:hypothetical protein